MLQHEGGVFVFDGDEGFVELASIIGVGVAASVRHKVALAHEIFGAQVATIRSIHNHTFLMGTLVEEQITLQSERFAAFLADVGEIARMRQHMLE